MSNGDGIAPFFFDAEGKISLNVYQSKITRGDFFIQVLIKVIQITY